jgi:hypothetical protein
MSIRLSLKFSNAMMLPDRMVAGLRDRMTLPSEFEGDKWAGFATVRR